MIKFDRSRRAFSLVEILFAVIIIGVLTAVAIPSLFSQKGKADDSNAKQTIRTVQQLVRSAQDDSGSFITDASGSLSGYLTTIEKDIKFVNGSTNAIVNGNTRTVSVSDPAADIVYIVAQGGKNGSGDTYNCFGMYIDGTGSTATKYYRYTKGKNSCQASQVSGQTGIEGDFPLK